MTIIERGRGWLVRGGALVLCAALVPRAVAGARAEGFWTGDAHAELGRAVAESVSSGVAATSFHTGSARFDGEWAFGTFLMATVGLGQVSLARPELRQTFLPAMRQSVARLVAPETNAFGTAAWHDVGLANLRDGEGHGYLGYANLALSMLRLVEPETTYAPLSDELTDALARRLARAPHALFETYPGEAYTPDMAIVAGSIALHDCAAGSAERSFMPGFRAELARYIEPGSGLLYQAANAANGEPLDAPRGSGTALAAYALSFVDARLSEQLFASVRRHAITPLGFGMVREYPKGRAGGGDIDSGPVLFGLGVSATGFALAGARLHADHELFTALYRTVDLVGVPVSGGGSRHFMSGGPLGNAILLAMTSASFDWRKHCRPVAP